MQALQSIKNGDVTSALRELQAEVRGKPSDPKLRTFLFQLLSIVGQWERAMNQLKVVGEFDPLATMMVHTYSRLLQAEALRAEVFAGKRTPVIIGEPPSWIALLFQALSLDSQGHHVEASELRAQAFDQADAVAGEIDGTPFEWIGDADPRLGPCVEVMVNGGYSWVPYTRIKRLKVEAPTDLRDKIWTPVEITWANDGQVVGFIPTRYPNSERAEDGALALARKTDWLEVADGVSFGLGQRLLATDVGDYPLLDTRVITFNHPATADI